MPNTTPPPPVAASELPQWIALGKIGRPHGVRGELRLQVYNTASQMWKPGLQLRLWKAGSPAQLSKIAAVRPAHDYWILRLPGVDDRDQAQALTGCEVEVDANALPPTPEDEFYLHELLGAAVIEAETGAEMGKVTGFVETAQTLLQIKLHGGGEAMIPVDAPAIEELGRVRGRVVVRHLEDWLT
jgi:16S rRNA processing protein RimM